LNYREYLESVSKKLQAAEFELTRDIKVARFDVDLYAFKDGSGVPVVTGTPKQISCIFVALPNVVRRDVEDFSKATVRFESEKRGVLTPHQGIFPTRLIVPVIISARPSQDAMAFFKDYDLSLAHQYLHPVLVNLDSGQVNHRVGIPFVGSGDDRILNGIVKDYLLPV
jgi:hypothetical protein